MVRMMDIDKLIQKAQAALEQVEAVPTGARVRLAEDEKTTSAEVWFKPMSPDEWREFIAVLPPRPAAYSDAMLGFDVDAATRLYPRMRLVVGDDITEPGPAWADMCKSGIVDAAARDIVTQALLDHHLFEPMRWQDAAGKASKGGRGKKPSSPASSASPSEN